MCKIVANIVGVVDIAVFDDRIVVEWSQNGDVRAFHLDRVDGRPRWIGCYADLAELSDRRHEHRVVDRLARFGRERGESVALFLEDGQLDWLHDPNAD